jgi:hypothetical protein
MTKDEALKLALEALELLTDTEQTFGALDYGDNAITAIKQALAQPAQEPVGKFAKFTNGIWREVTDGSPGVSLYTAPPQRPWVDLTSKQLNEIFEVAMTGEGAVNLARAKLKELNHE